MYDRLDDMLHVVEVDQSGKFEDTKVDTVLAFSDGITWSICIPAKDKRACVQILRKRGYSGKTFYLQLFVIGLFLLLKPHIELLSRIVLDEEYLGRNADIKRYLLNLFRRSGYLIEADRIQFWHIGKRSAAHITAYVTLQGERKPDRICHAAEILKIFSQ